MMNYNDILFRSTIQLIVLCFVSSNHDLFPLILTLFAQYNPSHIPKPLFTPYSLTSIKRFVWIGLHESDMLLRQILFHIWKSYISYRNEIFSRGGHGWGNWGRGNWNMDPRRPRFSIHFDTNSQELGQLFEAGFFN
jgi:hypothetical protein